MSDAARAEERRMLSEALRRAGGNVAQTARDLGMKRARLDQRMESLGMRKLRPSSIRRYTGSHGWAPADDRTPDETTPEQFAAYYGVSVHDARVEMDRLAANTGAEPFENWGKYALV